MPTTVGGILSWDRICHDGTHQTSDFLILGFNYLLTRGALDAGVGAQGRGWGVSHGKWHQEVGVFTHRLQSLS